jgi:hypothetical protein
MILRLFINHQITETIVTSLRIEPLPFVQYGLKIFLMIR